MDLPLGSVTALIFCRSGGGSLVACSGVTLAATESKFVATEPSFRQKTDGKDIGERFVFCSQRV